MSAAQLRKNGMMAHLMDALTRGEDIGHYGRLVFVMVARYFVSEDDLFRQLQMDPNIDDEQGDITTPSAQVTKRSICHESLDRSRKQRRNRDDFQLRPIFFYRGNRIGDEDVTHTLVREMLACTIQQQTVRCCDSDLRRRASIKQCFNTFRHCPACRDHVVNYQTRTPPDVAYQVRDLRFSPTLAPLVQYDH
jgi:hypothetical protein